MSGVERRPTNVGGGPTGRQAGRASRWAWRATTVEQLPDALKGAEVTLSADVLKAVNAVSRELRYAMG